MAIMDWLKIKSILESYELEERVKVLIAYGHQLTIMSREGYVFQGPGLTDPQLLRDANEIHHRLYPALNGLVQSDSAESSIDSISRWIASDESNETIRNASLIAFQMAVERHTKKQDNSGPNDTN